ncbi:MAG: MBOAT family protein [Eubacterium sp.]|nr:MBOAT family protein [Eubacterium sp.]
MTYIETGFLLFLLLTIGLYYLVPAQKRWVVLLIMSLVFYGFSGIRGFIWIGITSLSVWAGALQMGRYYEKCAEEQAGIADRKEKKAVKAASRAKCRKVITALVLLNIGILCVFKYARFVSGPVSAILTRAGFPGSFSATSLIMPLGISYYTFSAVGYVLDVYWQRVDCEKNYARFLLYEIYFLHILQGPIERYGRLGQRLKETVSFDYARACKGIQLMIWGFFKKLVIADRLNLFISAVYGEKTPAAGAVYLTAMLFDVVFIYADFSGCMDIARGASQIMGIEMDLNFDHPFASRSIVEFWRRWHMSLGGWFRDYVYMPLSTSGRVKKISRFCTKKNLPRGLTRGLVTVLPVFVTWILTGLWHGTGKPYLAWGVYYACWIFISVVFGDALHELALRLQINTDAWSWHAFQMIRTTMIFAGGRLLTRPDSLRKSWAFLKQMLLHFQPWTLVDGSLFRYGLDGKNFCAAVVAIMIFGVVSRMQMQMQIREKLAEQNLIFRWGICMLGILLILIFGIYGPGYDAASFVYMQY